MAQSGRTELRRIFHSGYRGHDVLHKKCPLMTRADIVHSIR